jgi:cysteine desulfurase
MLKKILLRKNKKKFIFMDYASGTDVGKRVFEKMKPFFLDEFYNPSAIYKEAFQIREVVDGARAEIAFAISARPKEIIFTDGGTEANNLVLRGLVSNWSKKNSGVKPHIIVSKIEHTSILETCNDLVKKNLADVSYISVDKNGTLNIKELKNSIKENTILVSVAYVNGEIGVVQNIREVAKSIRHHRKHNKTHFPYFHTDAIQAVNYFDVNVQKLGASNFHKNEKPY